jgi:multimeric flavodoxin WrbA
MNVVILDGAAAAGSQAVSLVETLARRAGASVTLYRPDELLLAPCQGDFDCWLKTPGLCRIQDDQGALAQAIHDADLLVYATPLTFGGYSAALKKLVDRMIGLLEPFFTTRDGLTRHTARYPTFPAILGLGWSDGPSEADRQTFAALVRGNAANKGAPWSGSLVFSPRDADWARRVEETLQAALGRAQADQPAGESPQLVLDAACAPDRASLAAAPRSATLLIGSARPQGQSTSESLGRALLEGLARGGVTTRVVHAVAFLKPGRAEDEALEALCASELLVVSTPLYVDSLPALVTHALSAAARRLAAGSHPVRSVVGLVNCGFPEAVHDRTAMRLLRAFAAEAGLVWAGGLAMGGGEAVQGRPMAEAGAMVRAQAKALALAARDLLGGRALSAEAIRLMARPVVPPFAYRWIGSLQWLWRARRYGLGRAELHARPLEAPAAPRQGGSGFGARTRALLARVERLW